MYEHFSDDARRSMQAANQEATRFGHDYIGIEHILLGILAQPGSVADACESLGVHSSTVEQAARNELGKSTARASQCSAKAVIGYAIEESETLRHQAIGTDHLMLAILRAAPPNLMSAIEATGLQCHELWNELVRRNPPGAHTPLPPLPPLEALVKQFRDHSEVQLLDQQVSQLQQEQGEALKRHDFVAAARLRDEKVEARRRLMTLLRRLLGES
jgi:transposase-like protein